MEAPRGPVMLSTGQEKALEKFWAREPLALVFMRHYG